MEQGFYIHVPYCHRKCHYCDFHISTGMKTRPKMLGAMVREIAMRQNYLPDRRLHTVYWGGGTPSLLHVEELAALMHAVHQHYDVQAGAEVTLECNPEDISAERLRQWHALGINRLSLGVQSLDDGILRFLGRAHRRSDVLRAFHMIERGPIHNISIDLIFGMAGLSTAAWQRMLRTASALPVSHLSVYELTIEGRNLLAHRHRRGVRTFLHDDETAAAQFQAAHQILEAHGFRHYEISNYARPGYESRHNMIYWHGRPYWGIGPSAHSYTGRARRTNIANNAVYIRRVNAGARYYEEEVLSEADRFNEWLVMRLRLATGLDRATLAGFSERYRNHLHQRIGAWVASGHMQAADTGWPLTLKGMLWANRIAADLMWPAAE